MSALRWSYQTSIRRIEAGLAWCLLALGKPLIVFSENICFHVKFMIIKVNLNIHFNYIERFKISIIIINFT